MNRDALLMYGDLIPLAVVLEHERLRSPCKSGRELRRAAARALNDGMAEADLTRLEFAERAEVGYEELSKICNARQGMDTGVLKQVLSRRRKRSVRFTEAIDYPRAARASIHPR
jgi:predicted transcriptional regulator